MQVTELTSAELYRSDLVIFSDAQFDLVITHRCYEILDCGN